jgi:hypothetical protein
VFGNVVPDFKQHWSWWHNRCATMGKGETTTTTSNRHAPFGRTEARNR